MSKVSDYAVVYDISSDRERTRVDKLLKSFGFRIQKSVFECRMNRAAREDLLRALDALNLETGFVKVYRQEYKSRPVAKGTGVPDNKDAGSAFIV